MADKLVEGFKIFVEANYGNGGVMSSLVSEGQNPDYFMISCIDSRSNPGTIFSTAPGTFFAHKAMGAIVRPYRQGTALSAALQFAISYNNVNKLIVLGHTQCGAVKALIDKIDDQEIASFVHVAQTSLDKAKKKMANDETDLPSLHRVVEQEIVLQSVENLKTYPSVANAFSRNALEIKAWMFDMKNGELHEHDGKTFRRIAGLEKLEHSECC